MISFKRVVTWPALKGGNAANLFTWVIVPETEIIWKSLNIIIITESIPLRMCGRDHRFNASIEYMSSK